ncbi:MAG: hypothetical protein R3Y28_01510 [Candidatus Gastranaerophilales bacterium]
MKLICEEDFDELNVIKEDIYILDSLSRIAHGLSSEYSIGQNREDLHALTIIMNKKTTSLVTKIEKITEYLKI